LRGYGVDYAQGNYLGKPREALMSITRPSARLQSIGQVD
jgi:EAL domain-containing protein (putative c-di-GMP-specific phosphodiesterase class I)